MANTNSNTKDVSDFSPSDLESINQFADAGLPGISAMDQGKIFRARDLYFCGHRYYSIARIFRVRKDLILYLAYKFNWHKEKVEHLAELREQIAFGLAEEKLQHKAFLIKVSQHFRKQIGKQIDAFYANGQLEIDAKEIDRQLKIMGGLNRLNPNETGEELASVPFSGFPEGLSHAAMFQMLIDENKANTL